jgi:hypothetical protein
LPGQETGGLILASGFESFSGVFICCQKFDLRLRIRSWRQFLIIYKGWIKKFNDNRDLYNRIINDKNWHMTDICLLLYGSIANGGDITQNYTVDLVTDIYSELTRFLPIES